MDVDYRAAEAVGAGVLFADWSLGSVDAAIVRRIGDVQPYRPGRFFERELPCLLAVLDDIEARLEAIVIDGYAVLGDGEPGLGAHLSDALDGRVPVIGVAKTRFRDTPPETEVMRGASRRPLYVTSIGMDAGDARRAVRLMHGSHRIPTMLAAVDRLARSGWGRLVGANGPQTAE